MKKLIILLTCLMSLNQAWAMEKDEQLAITQKLPLDTCWDDLPEEIKTHIFNLIIYDLVKNRISGNDLKEKVLNLKLVSKKCDENLNNFFNPNYINKLLQQNQINSQFPISAFMLGKILLSKENFDGFHHELTNVSIENQSKLDWDLYSAVEHGEIDDIKKLIEEGANVNYQDRFDRDDTALFRVYFNRNATIPEQKVNLLINAGIDVNRKSRDGATALIQCAIEGNLVVAKILLDAKADVNIQDKEYKTALIYAIKKGYEEIAELLIKGESNLNLKDENGFTALMWAAIKGNTRITMLLISANAELNLQSYADDTSLSLAMLNKHVDVIELLLKAGADVSRLDVNLTNNKKLCLDHNLIVPLVSAGLKIDKKAFSDFGCYRIDAEERYDEGIRRYNEILRCIDESDIQGLNKIMRKVMTLNVKFGHGNTPLHYAAEKNDKLMVITLLGKNPWLIAINNYKGQSPLDVAIECESWDVVKLLTTLATLDKS